MGLGTVSLILALDAWSKTRKRSEPEGKRLASADDAQTNSRYPTMHMEAQ
jgi:hypothetical protein